MLKIRWVFVVAVILLVAFSYVSYRMESTQRRVHSVAMINALQQFYDVAVGTNQADSGDNTFDPPSVRKRIIDRLGRSPQVLPSFVNADNIFVTHKAVPFQSTNLLLSIKAGDRLIYAITGDRQSRELSIDQFRSWQHEGL